MSVDGQLGLPPTQPPRRSTARVVLISVTVLVVCTVVVGVAAVAGLSVGRSKRTLASRPSAASDGVHNFLQDPRYRAKLTKNHVANATIPYAMTPPVGGDHSPAWQNCEGDVYPAPIGSENAVHSLEHGAVWVTYRPGLAGGDVQTLEGLVRGTEYTLMSPYPGLDTAVSVQAWGYQLKVDRADDPRLAAFVARYRIKAAPEPGATCEGGITDADGKPHDRPGDAGPQRTAVPSALPAVFRSPPR